MPDFDIKHPFPHGARGIVRIKRNGLDLVDEIVFRDFDGELMAVDVPGMMHWSRSYLCSHIYKEHHSGEAPFSTYVIRGDAMLPDGSGLVPGQPDTHGEPLVDILAAARKHGALDALMEQEIVREIQRRQAEFEQYWQQAMQELPNSDFVIYYDRRNCKVVIEDLNHPGGVSRVPAASRYAGQLLESQGLTPYQIVWALNEQVVIADMGESCTPAKGEAAARRAVEIINAEFERLREEEGVDIRPATLGESRGTQLKKYSGRE